MLIVMKSKLLFLLAGAIVISAFRLLPHPANFIPVGAFALFISHKFPSKYTIVFALIPMIISDIMLGFGWYSPFVYAGFIGYFLAGKLAKNYKSVTLLTLGSSIWFFIVTNLGVWLGPWYPHTYAGFLDCFVKAIPFFRNTILGDFVYLGLFYGVYELVKYLKSDNKYKEIKCHMKS